MLPVPQGRPSSARHARRLDSCRRQARQMASGRLPGFLVCGLPQRSSARANRGENTARPPRMRGRVFFRTTPVTQASLKSPDTQALDALTGGAFSAPTSGERAARVREWLAGRPQPGADAGGLPRAERPRQGRGPAAARAARRDQAQQGPGGDRRRMGREGRGAAGAAAAQHRRRDGLAARRRQGRRAAQPGAAGVAEGAAGRPRAAASRTCSTACRCSARRPCCWRSASRCCPPSPGATPRPPPTRCGPTCRSGSRRPRRCCDDPNWASVDTRFPPLLEASRDAAAGGVGGLPERAGAGRRRRCRSGRPAAAGAGVGRRTAGRARRAGRGAAQAGAAQGRSRAARQGQRGGAATRSPSWSRKWRRATARPAPARPPRCATR